MEARTETVERGGYDTARTGLILLLLLLIFAALFAMHRQALTIARQQGEIELCRERLAGLEKGRR